MLLTKMCVVFIGKISNFFNSNGVSLEAKSMASAVYMQVLPVNWICYTWNLNFELFFFSAILILWYHLIELREKDKNEDKLDIKS